MAYEFLADEKKKEKLGGLLGEIMEERERYYFLDALEKAELEKDKDVEILDEGAKYKIIRKKDENMPTYVIFLPSQTKKDKKILRAVEKRAITEIAIDPESILDIKKRRRTFVKEVMRIIEHDYPDLLLSQRRNFAELIVQNMIGYGLLEFLLADDALEEVMVVGTKKRVYVYHRKHGMCKTNIVFEDDAEIINIINKIARSVGRRVDMSAPLLDARLPDGSRVNATLRPVSLDGPSLTIRKFKASPFTIVDLIDFKTLTPELTAFLWLVVEGFGVKPINVLVSGGTSSGKTTTLNCLGSFIPSSDRVITIEDTAELQLPVEHWIRLETRPPNIEGKGGISMDVLLKNALRMRPDRIIVGEVRGPEAYVLLASMNTGQNGCLGTLHANTAKETITRLVSAPMSVPRIMIPSLNLILMQNKFTHQGKLVRRITEVAEITGMEDGKIKMEIIYQHDPRDDRVKSTGVPASIKKKLAELRGMDEKEVEEEIERRQEIIEYMVRKGMRSIEEVGRLINEYYTSPEKLFEKLNDRETKEEKAEKILKQDSSYKIVQIEGERNLLYVAPLPELSSEEKILLKRAEETAINEIEVDPTSLLDRKKAEEVFLKRVLEVIKENFPEITPAKREDFAGLIVPNMLGYGLLEFLLADDALEEVMVVGTGKPVYVYHREYGACKTNITFESEDEILRIIEKIARSVERRIDRATPLLDAMLLDGSRANATIPPIAINGPNITIRKFKREPLTVVNLINFRALNVEVAAYLWLIVEGLGIKAGNILVAGGSSSGKTSTLNCLASFIQPADRVITIEDTAELRMYVEHSIRLETRLPSIEGSGEISMDDLVKNTLRMRPDRIIVGEVRGPEARTLFTAMNTGHDGCMGTVHSNSARETITRLTNPPMNVPEVMLPALDLIIMQSKFYSNGKVLRRITEIAEVVGWKNGKFVLNNVYKWNPKKDTLESTGNESVLKQKIAKLKGMRMKELNEELERRENILKWMVGSNITELKEVARFFNEYYTNPQELLKRIK
ncbi:MAG: CpaF family protein [Candidatus Hydrothermarchaeota archaeon]|nr:CpaF family protein [Candidatus Hydrothermarchaeota archaeon]